jgi:hypothetical protein
MKTGSQPEETVNAFLERLTCLEACTQIDMYFGMEGEKDLRRKSEHSLNKQTCFALFFYFWWREVSSVKRRRRNC